MLSSKRCSLKSLSLKGSQLGPPGVTAVFGAIAEGNGTLTHLDISGELHLFS